jgi:hypothetical protein
MQRVLSLLVLATVAAVAAGAASAPAGAKACAQLSLSGRTALNPATGTVDGTFVGTVDGRPTSIFSSTTILGQEQQGTILVIHTSHLLVLEDGTRLRTLDKARLKPTATPGVYRASSRLEIVSGGSGYLVGGGMIDFRGGLTAVWHDVRGLLCG